MARIYHTVSSNRPTPFTERTNPEIPVVIGRYQMPTQIEYIVDSGISANESLRLPD